MGPRTRAYVERRTAEGRTLRGTRRCLKCYFARDHRLNTTDQHKLTHGLTDVGDATAAWNTSAAPPSAAGS